MTGIRAAQKRFTRQLLLESALKVFCDKDYISTKIDDIAAGAGATRTTFYLHFKSKADVMHALLDEINDHIVSSDNPALTEVARIGSRDEIRKWVNRRLEQWPIIMPYVRASMQAAVVEPTIAERVNSWHDSAIDEIFNGLTQAGRFEPAERAPRAVAAFGQIEYTSRAWHRKGWTDRVARESMLEVLTDSIYQLVGED